MTDDPQDFTDNSPTFDQVNRQMNQDPEETPDQEPQDEPENTMQSPPPFSERKELMFEQLRDELESAQAEARTTKGTRQAKATGRAEGLELAIKIVERNLS